MPTSLPRAVRELTSELTRLPGIGPKSAQRLAIYLLRQPQAVVTRFAKTISTLHENVTTCMRCFNLAESERCTICKDSSRIQTTICVVEDPLDVDAIERTDSYTGLYHVLGGTLSPVEGITADQLALDELTERVQTEGTEELIIALDHSMEGEATTRHIMSRVKQAGVRITRLARGLPTGGDIEFADAMTLTAAFNGRMKIE